MERPDYRNRNALVLGLGVFGGGTGVARFLAQRGAKVTVTDLQPAERLAGSIAALRDYDVRFVLGEHREEDVRQADFVVRNPAVPRSLSYLRLADSLGIPVYMEMSLFFLECRSRRISGITGTKGKTTTTTLVGEVLTAAGRDVVVAGNLRVSALEQLPRIGPETEVVLELSSFQLEGLEVVRRSPALAAVTNLLPDHLNRYPSLADYYAAKTQIYRHQDADGVLVLNRDNPPSREYAAEAPGRVLWFGEADDVPGADRSLLAGRHNRANLAAGAAIARGLGIADRFVERAVADFRGVPYRQEVIRDRDGVQFVNDSAATTPDAVLAALGAATRPVVLIAGGADKELDFTGLGQAVTGAGSPVKGVVLLDGSATDKVERACGPKVQGRYGSLEAALSRAVDLAVAGDIVLLSPGCASFGMFANEFDRGDQFNALVRSL